MPGRACYIDMGPIVIAGKLRQKTGCRDATGWPPTYIGQVRKVALELLLATTAWIELLDKPSWSPPGSIRTVNKLECKIH